MLTNGSEVTAQANTQSAQYLRHAFADEDDENDDNDDEEVEEEEKEEEDTTQMATYSLCSSICERRVRRSSSWPDL